MPEFEEILRTAFAARTFTGEAVTDADLTAVFELARFAPSGGNRQGWRVVVVRDPARKRELVELGVPAARLYAAQRDAGENPYTAVTPSRITAADVDPDLDVGWWRALAAAPVLLVVGVDLRLVASTDKDLGRIGVTSGGSIYPFVQNVLLAARARGLAGALTTFVSSAEPEVQRLVGFPPEIAIAAMVPLGHPDKVLTRLRRKPVSDFARVERWDGAPLG